MLRGLPSGGERWRPAPVAARRGPSRPRHGLHVRGVLLHAGAAAHRRAHLLRHLARECAHSPAPGPAGPAEPPLTAVSLLSLQIIAFDELKTDYKNPIDQCNTLNPVSSAGIARPPRLVPNFLPAWWFFPPRPPTNALSICFPPFSAQKTVEKVKKIKRVKIALKVCTAARFDVFGAASMLLGWLLTPLRRLVSLACPSASALSAGFRQLHESPSIPCAKTIWLAGKRGKLLHARYAHPAGQLRTETKGASPAPFIKAWEDRRPVIFKHWLCKFCSCLRISAGTRCQALPSRLCFMFQPQGCLGVLTWMQL